MSTRQNAITIICHSIGFSFKNSSWTSWKCFFLATAWAHHTSYKYGRWWYKHRANNVRIYQSWNQLTKWRNAFNKFKKVQKQIQFYIRVHYTHPATYKYDGKISLKTKMEQFGSPIWMRHNSYVTLQFLSRYFLGRSIRIKSFCW